MRGSAPAVLNRHLPRHAQPVEFAKLTLVDGKPVYTVLKPEEVQSLLEEGKRIKNEEEAAEKAKKEAKARQRKAAQKDGADK